MNYLLKKKHSIDSLFVLLLYAVFVIMSLTLVLVGARVYKHITDKNSESSNIRTSLYYVANKIRTCDTADGISLEKINGIDVLALKEDSTETLIYYYKGQSNNGEAENGIYELIRDTGTNFDPSLGQWVADVSSYKVTEKDGLYTITTTINGKEYNVCVSKRT